MKSPTEAFSSKVSFPDAVIERIAFVPRSSAEGQTLAPLPESLGRVAIRLGEQAPLPPEALGDCHMLLVPESTDADNGSPGDRLEALQEWTAASQPPDFDGHLLTFQGVQICWSPRRCAILADAERLPAIRDALLEVTYCELELRQIEQRLAAAWPDAEADLPLAFEFGERALPQRQQLKQRFQETLRLRGRLARLGPSVHAPHRYPPTLASQLNERLRERARMMHRHEFAGEQLEVLETVYEQAAQRASDFVHTRSGNILEWIIIVLLLAQLTLSLVELLASSGN